MKVLYNETGEIINIVHEKDWYKIDPENLFIYEIDEMNDDNKPIINIILKNLNKINSEGLGKYYIKDDELFERKNWRELKEKGNIIYE